MEIAGDREYNSLGDDFSENKDSGKGSESNRVEGFGSGDADFSAELLSLRQELLEQNDKYLRLMAEFENYKKRADIKIEDAQKFGISQVVKDFIPVLEDLHRALANFDENLLAESRFKSWYEGIDMTKTSFEKVLAKHSVQRLYPLGEQFDPELHSAIAYIDGEQEGGTILQVLRAGYVLHGRLLLAAEVIVSRGEKS